MGLKKNNPGCGCCCKLLSDDFARSDSTDLGANWTETAGSWSIASGELVTASSAAFCEATVAVPVNNGVHISVTAEASASTSTARVIVNYQDANNFNFVEVRFGTGAYLRLYERSGGTDTLLNSQGKTLAINTPTTLVVCYFDGILSASQGGSTRSAVVNFDGGSFGVGSGANVGNIIFDNFVATKISDNCEECEAQPCIQCCKNDTWNVYIPPDTFGGGSSEGGPFPCACTVAQCGDVLNDNTFVLERTGSCAWAYEEDIGCTTMRFELSISNCALTIIIRELSGSISTATWATPIAEGSCCTERSAACTANSRNLFGCTCRVLATTVAGVPDLTVSC